MNDNSFDPTETETDKTWRGLFDGPFDLNALSNVADTDTEVPVHEPAYPEKPNPLAYDGLPPGHIALMGDGLTITPEE